MKYIVYLLLIYSISVSALDCPINETSLNWAWNNSEYIFHGIPIEAKLKNELGGGLLKYEFKVLDTFKGKNKIYRTVHAENYESQMFQIGMQYIVFLDENGNSDWCKPNQPFLKEWYEEENRMRADIPHELLQKVYGEYKEKP